MCLEKQGFHLCRTTTGDDHIFIHFLSSAEAYLGGEWVKLKKGACVFWRADSYQEYRSPADTALFHNYFHIKKYSAEYFENLLQSYGLTFETPYYPADSTAITEIVQQIEIELLRKQAFFDKMCVSHLEELLIHLARNADNEDNISVDAHTYRQFTALRQRFHIEFNKNWTVDTMASSVNLSPSRFHSLYRQIFNISPKKDFLHIRIEHAKMLMQNGNYSIREIAELAGYNNQYHFIRQFREVTGITPGKYIKNKNIF